MKAWNGVHHPHSRWTDADYCARCGRLIKGDPVSLELNSHNGDYRDDSMVNFPPGQSQGWFVFGKNCAARTLEEQRRHRIANMNTELMEHDRANARRKAAA